MRFVVVPLLREAVLVEVERVTRDESVMTLCVRVNVLLIAAGPWRAREECVPVGSNALFWKNPLPTVDYTGRPRRKVPKEGGAADRASRRLDVDCSMAGRRARDARLVYVWPKSHRADAPQSAPPTTRPATRRGTGARAEGG